jgi:hypothetical protein
MKPYFGLGFYGVKGGRAQPYFGLGGVGVGQVVESYPAGAEGSAMKDSDIVDDLALSMARMVTTIIDVNNAGGETTEDEARVFQIAAVTLTENADVAMDNVKMAASGAISWDQAASLNTILRNESQAQFAKAGDVLRESINRGKASGEISQAQGEVFWNEYAEVAYVAGEPVSAGKMLAIALGVFLATKVL